MNSLDIVFDTCQKEMDIDLAKMTKKAEFVRAKWIFYGVVYSLGLRYSQEDIGKKTKRDRTSVVHGLKMFPIDILGVEKYNNLYNRCLEACSLAINIKDSTNKQKGVSDSIMQHFRRQELEITELKAKIKRVASNPILRDISELDEQQYHTFMDRYKVMIKMIKSIRTYENTPKKEFNAA